MDLQYSFKIRHNDKEEHYVFIQGFIHFHSTDMCLALS